MTRLTRTINVANRLWRPLLYFSLLGSFVINAIALPLMTSHPADLATLATLCATLAPLCALRGVEKHLARTVPSSVNSVA